MANDEQQQPAPLSDERLQQIRERAEQVPGSSFAKTQKDISRAFFDRATLLEEVARLKEREARLLTTLGATQDVLAATASQHAAMREIVQWVASLDPVSDEARAHSGLPGWLPYDAKAAQARAILAQQPE